MLHALEETLISMVIPFYSFIWSLKRKIIPLKCSCGSHLKGTWTWTLITIHMLKSIQFSDFSELNWNNGVIECLDRDALVAVFLLTSWGESLHDRVQTQREAIYKQDKKEYIYLSFRNWRSRPIFENVLMLSLSS